VVVLEGGLFLMSEVPLYPPDQTPLIRWCAAQIGSGGSGVGVQSYHAMVTIYKITYSHGYRLQHSIVIWPQPIIMKLDYMLYAIPYADSSRGVVRWCVAQIGSGGGRVQVYLSYKKQLPPRTLQ
jgi:hypothetical protein